MHEGLLLNQHLDEIILAGKAYPRAKVERVYAKLTAPRKPGYFYQGSRARGFVEDDGFVWFETQYPELDSVSYPGGWTDFTPEEIGINRTSPLPIKDTMKLQRTWDSYINSSAGKGVFYNSPNADPNDPEFQWRADVYRERGFKDIGYDEKGQLWQVLDNRRFKNLPTISQLYAIGDRATLPLSTADILRANLPF